MRVTGNWRLIFRFEQQDVSDTDYTYYLYKKEEARAMTQMAPKLNPSHPGEYVREDCLKPLGLSITEAAEGLDISRKHLSEIVNGHAGISPDMAYRLSKAFGSTPEMWLRLQMRYDLTQARADGEKRQVRNFRQATE